jgi:hypothetical protein
MPFVPLASTGLAGLAKPAVAPNKEVKAAAKAVGEKEAKKAAEEKEIKKEVDARKAYKQFTRAILRIWPEIKTFNDDGTIFQKSPRESLKVFCDHVVSNAKSMSSKQQAAIAEMLSAIRGAKTVGALGKDEEDLSALNSIRRRGMNVVEIKDFTKRLQTAIQKRKAYSAIGRKSKKAKEPAVKSPEKLVDISKHVKNEIAKIDKENERRAKKEGAGKSAAKPIALMMDTGIRAEPLMQNATSQASKPVVN